MYEDLSLIPHRLSQRFWNWAQTYTSVPSHTFYPEHIDQLQAILATARKEKREVRCFGGGNSPSDICLTEDFLVSLDRMQRVLQVRAKAVDLWPCLP